MFTKMFANSFKIGHPKKMAVRKELKKIEKKRYVFNLSAWELDNVKQVTNCEQKTENKDEI